MFNKYKDQQGRDIKPLTMSGRGLSWTAQLEICEDLYVRGYRGWVEFVISTRKRKAKNRRLWYVPTVVEIRSLL